MNLPQKAIEEIKEKCCASMGEDVKTNKKKAIEKKLELEEVKQSLHAVEEKWFKDEINRHTYNRWYSTYSDHVLTLTAAVERLSLNPTKAFELLDNNLDMLSHIRYIYDKATTLQKREFVNQVFDGNFYYQEGIYRTPTMLTCYRTMPVKWRKLGVSVIQ